MKSALLAVAALLCSAAAAPAQLAPPISDQDVSDAYIYLLGRLLVTRQQQLDFREG